MNNFTEIAYSAADLVFYREFVALKKYIYCIILAIVGFGMASNSVNIVVFVKMGLKDNVTITVLFLSISDLLYLIIQSPPLVGRQLKENHPQVQIPFDPNIIILGPYWWAYLFYDYSSLVSVFLGAVRCACVARPLRFKTMFTSSRTLAILCTLFLLAVALSTPVLTVLSLTRAVNPKTNLTYSTIAISSNIRQIYRANEIINRNIIPWVAYIAVITCVVILASKLREASRFRRSLTNSGGSRNENSNDAEGVVRGKKSLEKMSGKDLQVVQSVTLICIIFIFSQLPYQLISIFRFLFPEFSSTGKYMNMYAFAAHIKDMFTYINASVNIFVHLRFNTRYKETFFCLFFCKKGNFSTRK